MNENKKLKEIIVDLLYELRISKKSLMVMADGKSPNLPGIIDAIDGEDNNPHYPVVQISKDLAKMIIELQLNWY